MPNKNSLQSDRSADEVTLRAEIERLQAELAEARRQIAALEARADVDPLLDVLNRRGFERELMRSLAYIARYEAEAVLIYIDLDGFKAINDRHGHAAGDAMLKAIAARLAAQVRASDVVGRLGGDEFGVVMWHLDEITAQAKGRELERLIEEVNCTFGGADLAVGASAGVAPLGEGLSPSEAIDRADRAMYVRKRERRGVAR